MKGIDGMAQAQRYMFPTSAAAGFKFKPVFADKKTNSSGLQLADLAARPLGLDYLHPGQSNRAADLLKTKLTTGGIRCAP